jgi:iron complex transport system permease protein
MNKRTTVLALLLIAAIAALSMLSLVSGPAAIGAGQLFHGLDETARTIVFQLRLPRILMALLAGAALGISGALMQTFFRNPLAEPYITGVSAGGALGAVLGASLLGTAAAGVYGVLGTGGCAIAGALIVTAALYAFALRNPRGAQVSILLLGIALGTLCGAMIWLLLLRLGPGGTDQAVSWLLGRVSTVGYTEVIAVAAALLLGSLLAWRHLRDLDALLLGEEKAVSLGVDLGPARRGILGAATLLAAVCVAFCGVIAFVGLIVPHIARSATGAIHARLLPLAALGGAALLLAMDLLARTVDPPREIPLTVLTSLLGAPFFIAVLLKTRTVAL